MGAVKMEASMQNGLHTNHDRGARMNGLDGVSMAKPELEQGKGKEAADASKLNGVPGATAGATGAHQGTDATRSAAGVHRMDELPEEIQHITTDIMPLSLLLTRLAQVTHNEAEQLINQLAAKPLPDVAVNGNGDSRAGSAEDTSPESLEKKKMLLDFLKEQHNRWVKALVLTEWSKKSELVGKLIDIRSYLAAQIDHFGVNINELVNVKRQLHFARGAAPDLKTALEILDEGDAPFLTSVRG